MEMNNRYNEIQDSVKRIIEIIEEFGDYGASNLVYLITQIMDEN